MEPHVYVGVDWHKRTSTWVALNEEREVVLKRTYPCTPEGVADALHALSRRAEKIALAVEPVCGWRWMSRQCMDAGIDTHIANPKGLRQIAQTGKKTDKEDAHTIAELLRANYLPQSYRAPEEVHALRTVVRHRAGLVRITTALKCRIHGHTTALGAHATAARPLLKAGREAILANPAHLQLTETFALLADIAPYIKRAEEQMAQRAKSDSMITLLMTMPGVGIITATAIMAEVGDFARFKTPGALASYAGLVPRERSSGERRILTRISKEGSRILRYSIVEAAMRVRETERSANLFAYYRRLIEHRKTPKQARVALARKMLTCLWYMAMRGVAYDDRALQPTQSGMIS